MTARRLRLTCPDCGPDQVDGFVAGLAAEAGLDRRQAYRLRLATDEITTNVGQHGYRGGDGVIELTGGVELDRVWIRIQDEAPPFDPRGHDPTDLLATSLADRPVGGYGLLLARTNLDEFDYEYTGGRNHTTLIVYRAGSREEQKRGTSWR